MSLVTIFSFIQSTKRQFIVKQRSKSAIFRSDRIGARQVSLGRHHCDLLPIRMDLTNSDPLYSLPYELWIKCIRLYACDQPEGPLPLLTVSTAWQYALLESPVIWTTIYFDGGHDEECRAECFFHLSRDYFVDVVVGINPGSMKIATRFGHKIRYIFFWNELNHVGLTLGPSYLTADNDDDYFLADDDDDDHLTDEDGDDHKQHAISWYSRLIHINAIHSYRGGIFLPNILKADSHFVTLLEKWTQQRGDIIEIIHATANLAGVYHHLGRKETSTNVGADIWLESKVTLGGKHIADISAQISLAITYIRLLKWERAEPLVRNISKLADSYRNQKLYHEAEILQLEVIKLLNMGLGQDYLGSMSAAEKLASMYDCQDRFVEAETLRKGLRKKYRWKYFSDLLANTHSQLRRESLLLLIDECCSSAWLRQNVPEPGHDQGTSMLLGFLRWNGSWRCLQDGCQKGLISQLYALGHVREHMGFRPFVCSELWYVPYIMHDSDK